MVKRKELWKKAQKDTEIKNLLAPEIER